VEGYSKWVKTEKGEGAPPPFWEGAR